MHQCLPVCTHIARRTASCIMWDTTIAAKQTYVMSDYSKYETKGRYGILNRITGMPLTPAIFSDVEMLSKELFKVQIADGGSWYIVDKMGNMVSYEQ